jgi:hypothetical protein
VDSSLGTVLVFAGESTTGHAFAAQASTTAMCVCGTGQTTGGYFAFADFGPLNGDGIVLHSGDFDNNYYSNTGPTTVTGFMYVCAIDPNGPPGGGGNTALRRIIFNSDGLVTGADTADYLPVATDPSDECSPVTEVYNPNGGGTGVPLDLMFFSVQAHSIACGETTAAPAGGCLMSVDVTDDLTVPDLSTFAAFLPEDGGTSGIVVDNVSTEAQASSIYFTPLGFTVGWSGSAGPCTLTGCAVKATQVGLQ